MRRYAAFPLVMVSAGGIALLITLAILQYQWLGQLSEAEAGRMRRQLHVAATQLARDLDAEIGRLHTQIALGRFYYGQRIEDEVAERYAGWANHNSHRGIIAAVYLASAKSSGPVLRRLNFAQGRFEDTAWPPTLTAVRERLRAVDRRDESSRFPAQPDYPGKPLLLFSPYFGFRPPRTGEHRRPGPPPAPPHLIIIELDEAYILRNLVPALVQKHLSRDGILEYHVRVVDAASNDTLYDSEPSTRGVPIPRPDAVVPLLAARPGFVFRRDRNGFSPAAGPPSPPFGPGAAPWLLLVVHRAGSLETVVGAVRNRNLAIGFGVLAMLAAAIAILLVALRRSQRLAQLQLEFVAGVSHELRTPLSVIRSAGENLADGVTQAPGAVRRYGALVRDEGRRLSEMVDQILAFARTTQPMERRPAEVSELVERAIAACAHELRDSGCELIKDFELPLPAVEADATAISHALRNLISNAAVHGACNAPIRVSARQNGGAVEIEVADQGPGIEAEDLRHIFDPFYRGRRALQDQTRGLGLGLSLVKRIVEAHGGKVAAANNPGGGARFTVRLPVASSSAV